MAGQKFLTNINGEINEARGVQTGGSGNASKIVALNDATGLLDVSMLPVGVGPDIYVANATEALAAGAFVNIYDSSGPKVRNADASGGIAKQADGFVLAAVASGASATVYLGGLNTSVTTISGTTTPVNVFLGAVGAATATAPSTAAYIAQKLGKFIPGSGIQFDGFPPLVIAA